MKQGNLPEGFPSLAALDANGITTFAQLRKARAEEDWPAQVDGIGPSAAEKIDAALAAAEPITVSEEPQADEAPAPTNRRKATVDRRAGGDPVVPDIDYADLKNRAEFAKPRNEALIAEVRAKLGSAQQRITEAGEALEKLVHVEA